LSPSRSIWRTAATSCAPCSVAPWRNISIKGGLGHD
jgi:hypothetical protein